MWAYFSALKSKDTKYPLMVIKCLYEPQRASESLYMTELRNKHFIRKIQGGILNVWNQCHLVKLIGSL